MEVVWYCVGEDAIGDNSIDVIPQSPIPLNPYSPSPPSPDLSAMAPPPTRIDANLPAFVHRRFTSMMSKYNEETQSVEIQVTPEKPVFHRVVFVVILTHSSSPFASHRYRLWLSPTSITDSDHPKEDSQQVGIDKCGLSCSYIPAKLPTPPRHRYHPTGPSNSLASVEPSYTWLFPWRQRNPSAAKYSGVSSGTIQPYAAVQQVYSWACDPPAGTGTYPGSVRATLTLSSQ